MDMDNINFLAHMRGPEVKEIIKWLAEMLVEIRKNGEYVSNEHD